MLMVICAAIGAGATAVSAKPLPIAIAMAIGVLLMFSVIVPSSTVETMGLGGMLAIAALNKNN
jgi:hypothetical protein